MIYYENECVSCGFPCLYNSCSYYKVKHFKCDFCHEEESPLYHYNDYEICEKCLVKEFDIVEGSE